MPLAIELAAARVRSMALAELLDRLDDQLGLLTTGSRDVPRQQTLPPTLEWSHELLAPEERVVFRRVAVFAGGFRLDAAESVAHQGREDVARRLTAWLPSHSSIFRPAASVIGYWSRSGNSPLNS
jgi:predicted ATPase